jgi:hypothetical protein
MQDLFPVLVVTASAFAIKFLIDMIEPAKPPGWLKNVLSLGISVGFMVVYQIDVLAAKLGKEPSLGGYVLSGLMLAAVASKAVHPAVDAIRGMGRKET